MMHVRDRLQRYLDRELPAAAAAEVEDHLRACTPCRQELAELRRLWELVDIARQPPSQGSIWPRLAGRTRPRRPARWLVATALAAGLMLGLVSDRLLSTPATDSGEGGYLQDLATMDEIWWDAGQEAGS